MRHIKSVRRRNSYVVFQHLFLLKSQLYHLSFSKMLFIRCYRAKILALTRFAQGSGPYKGSSFLSATLPCYCLRLLAYADTWSTSASTRLTM